jgi:SSS family solute:Na+ symporter
VSPLDWLVLGGALAFVVGYGVYKGRRQCDMNAYVLADRKLQWPTIALSIMATQASAITFLSTPGQAYADGMRFLQIYLALPIAMVILSVTAVPIYHRLKVYTAYEYLETRFGVWTRSLTALLFLLQRGVSTGFTIYAPSLIVSVLLGWNIHWTNVIIGALVIGYTTFGGNKAVSWTHMHQMLIILGGMTVALIIAVRSIPADIGFGEAVLVAGRMGRLNAIDFSFDLTNKYNFWSGMIGGFFLMLSYFGTDQSQVQRYLTGRDVTESRLGLLFNGLVKVPMQFFILFVGAMVFVFYQFIAPPLFFNTTERARIGASRYAADYERLEEQHRQNFIAKRTAIRQLVSAMRVHDDAASNAATASVRTFQAQDALTHNAAADLLRKNDPKADTSDTNYIFLSFVIRFLPAGVVGLVLAAIFCASMSSTASALNSLASTSVVDIYRRLLAKNETEGSYVSMSRWMTVFWGVFSIVFAEVISNVGSLVELVNVVGSLFYGTILAVFLLAFYTREVSGTATFLGAILGEAAVVYCAIFTSMAYLWWNVVGCLVSILAALVIEKMLPARQTEAEIAVEL